LIGHNFFCSSILRQLTLPTHRWQKIQREFVQVEAEVAQLAEFRGLDEFAVMYQPWSRNVSVIILFSFLPIINCITFMVDEIYGA